ncbi:hypothetical protein L1P06_03870 [Edwardsiella piscicida]|uniref:hypothetical protein n=1 Tax=Edwardsiella piscicida TaxID=1263550 RepID=UPI001F2D9EFA|nr:hypothetical protein [Edwardsiella piscicida]UJT79724.1 hypothetical protein L1P06_03870 [Edwardsiella piscicida]
MFNFTTIPNIKQNSTFRSITWQELIILCRTPHKSRAQAPETTKHLVPLVAAHDVKSRIKTEAEAGLFGLLRADLDNAEGQTPETIADALREQGLGSFIIYSTLSHQPNKPRYRVFVELDAPVQYSTWADLQLALAELLGSDPCVNRSAQFMILPTLIESTTEHYQYLVGEGGALSPFSPFWLNAMESAARYQANAKATTYKVIEPTPRPFTERLMGNQVSIIELVNSHYWWPELLEDYGYKQKGRNAWIAPESTSGTAGVHILTSSTDGKERIYSHHESDPAGRRLCDKFDLITIRSFGGDYRKALEAIAHEVFPEAHQHNLKEWRTTQANQRAAEVFK